MDFMGVLAAAGQAVGILKSLRDLDKGFDAAEYKGKVAEVTSTVADLRLALVEASETIRAKEQEIERLSTAMARRPQLVEREGYLYSKRKDGGPAGLPFCPVCIEDKARYYQLTGIAGESRDSCSCPKCKARYLAQEYLWD